MVEFFHGAIGGIAGVAILALIVVIIVIWRTQPSDNEFPPHP